MKHSESGIKGIRILLLCLALTCFLPPFSWPRENLGDTAPALTVSLDRNETKVGALVTITLSYRLPEGAELVSPLDIKGLEDLTIIDMEKGLDRIRIRVLVDRLSPWKSEKISITYRDRDGASHTLASEDPVSLTVLSNLGERPSEAELRPIQGILSTTPRWVGYLPWTGGVFLLLAGTAAIWLYRRRRRLRSLTEYTEPPHVLARKEMEDLEAQGLFERGEVKAYYFRFSEILRRYLERVRGFPAAESTTEEIARRINRETDRKVLPLLRNADLVKFADRLPSVAKKDEDRECALSYIRETASSIETGLTKDSEGREGR